MPQLPCVPHSSGLDCNGDIPRVRGNRAAPDESKGNRMNSVAELEVLILRQQELMAKLARIDHMPGARAARSKLFGLLNQLDLAQGIVGTK